MLLDVEVYEGPIEEVVVARGIRRAETQLDAGMGIPHTDVEKRLRDGLLK